MSHFTLGSLPDPSVHWADSWQKVDSSIRATTDICLVGWGVPWNYACWQSWKALSQYQTQLLQMQSQNSPTVTTTTTTTTTTSTSTTSTTTTTTTIGKVESLKKASPVSGQAKKGPGATTGSTTTSANVSEFTSLKSFLKRQTCKIVLVNQELETEFCESVGLVVGTPAVLVYIHGSLVPVQRAKEEAQQVGWIGALNLESVHSLLQACFRFVQQQQGQVASKRDAPPGGGSSQECIQIIQQ